MLFVEKLIAIPSSYLFHILSYVFFLLIFGGSEWSKLINEQKLNKQVDSNDLTDELSDEPLDRAAAGAFSSCACVWGIVLTKLRAPDRIYLGFSFSISWFR